MENAYLVLGENCCFGLRSPYVCHSGSSPHLHFRGQTWVDHHMENVRVCATSWKPGCSSTACKMDATSRKISAYRRGSYYFLQLYTHTCASLLVLSQFDIWLYPLQSLILLKDHKDFFQSNMDTSSSSSKPLLQWDFHQSTVYVIQREVSTKHLILICIMHIWDDDRPPGRFSVSY